MEESFRKIQKKQREREMKRFWNKLTGRTPVSGRTEADDPHPGLSG